MGLSSLLFPLLSMLCAFPVGNAEATTYRLGVMPKSTSNPYFDPVKAGCEARARALGNVICDWVGPEDEDTTGEAQADIINKIVDMRENGTLLYDGLAISAMNEEALVGPIERALNSGISIICFDSDAGTSKRQAYVGTDNFAFGEQLGKVLLQLRPEGGLYAIKSLSIPNLNLRVKGIRRALLDTTWRELPDSFLGDTDALTPTGQMDLLKTENPQLKALIPTFGRPMKDESEWVPFIEKHRDLKVVVADAQSVQVDLMNRGYADGLVGQLPYQSGEACIDTLLELQTNGNPPRQENDVVFGTTLSLLLRIPLILPQLTVDMNYIGNIAVLGYAMFALLAFACLGFAAWVVLSRKTRVIRAAQPIFLFLIVTGVLLMSASIIPMTIDDEDYSQHACDIACNATPWLLSLGFSLTFAALFSKLWRIDRVLEAARLCRRKTVTIRDVVIPLLVILTLNLIILICWTTLAPLKYTRASHDGTDPWNRVISTYGSCGEHEHISSAPFIALLAVLNMCALIIANVQAYRTRMIKTEFSESKYIAIALASMAQAGIVGVPLLFLVGDQPRANFVVRVLLVFVTCSAILVLIFVPKILKRNKTEKLKREGTVSNVSSRLGVVQSSQQASRFGPRRGSKTEMENQFEFSDFSSQMQRGEPSVRLKLEGAVVEEGTGDIEDGSTRLYERGIPE